jgi:hypothetical protein
MLLMQGCWSPLPPLQGTLKHFSNTYVFDGTPKRDPHQITEVSAAGLNNVLDNLFSTFAAASGLCTVLPLLPFALLMSLTKCTFLCHLHWNTFLSKLYAYAHIQEILCCIMVLYCTNID